MTDPAEYVVLAIKVLKKAKGYCQNQATDEPQVLALAEQLRCHHLGDYGLLDAAVTRIGGSSAAADPSYHMTPARIVAEARSLRDDAANRAPLPQLEAPVATEEHRQQCLTEIRRIVGKQSRRWSLP